MSTDSFCDIEPMTFEVQRFQQLLMKSFARQFERTSLEKIALLAVSPKIFQADQGGRSRNQRFKGSQQHYSRDQFDGTVGHVSIAKIYLYIM